MLRSRLPHCYRYVTSSFVRQVKSHFKLGLLITFHYHTVLCNCQKTRSGNSTICVQMADQMSTDSRVFSGNVDRYKGVHVKSADHPCNLAIFTSKLEASLQQWMSDKLQALWFYVSLEHSEWIPVLTKNGFRFHHTARDGSTVALVRWLGPEPSRVPVFAHTMVGVGAVVVDSEHRLLVVQESYRGNPYWKLPGGYIEPGEDVPAAAMREVLEETDIQTEFRSLIAFRHSHSAQVTARLITFVKFRSLIAFRHSHSAQFGCSDLYFIVELAPLSSAITSCEVEIEDCQWMDIATYLSHPNVHENNRLFVRKYLYSREKGLSINATKTVHPVTNAPQTLFALGPVE